MSKGILRGSIGLLAAVVLASGCGSDEASGTGGSAGSAGSGGAGGGGGSQNEVVVGVIQSITGTDASLGTTLRDAAKVAEQHINAHGGVLGSTFRLDIRDDKGDSAVCTQQAQEMIQMGVAGVLGATTSGMTTNIHQLFYDAKMVLISAGATTPTLSTAQPPTDRYFFRTVPTGVLHGKVLGRVARHGPASAPAECAKVFTAYEDDAYGKPYNEQLITTFQELGGQVLGSVGFPKEAKASYETEVQQIIAAQPECITLVSYIDAGAQLLKDFKKAKDADTSGYDWSTVRVYAGNTFNTADFITKGRLDPANPQSETVAEGVYGANIDIAPKTTEFSEFRNLWSASFPLAEGENPPRNTANQFDAAIVLALAIQKAGGVSDRVKLRDAIYDVSQGGKSFGPLQYDAAIAALELGQDIDYTGASGLLDFDAQGDITTDFIIWAVQGGEMKTIDTVKGATLQ